MTNLVLLSFQLLTTNVFPVGASDPYGGWEASFCWNAKMQYAVPTNLQPSVWAVEYTSSVQTNFSTWTNADGVVQSLYTGMPWTELDGDLGRFTNVWNGRAQTNTVIFPIPPEPTLFFRLKRVL